MSEPIRVLHLMGVADSKTVTLSRISRDPAKMPMHFSGNVELSALVGDEFEVVRMLCGALPSEPFRAKPFAVVLNGICDPDTNAEALRAAASIVDQVGVKVFNDPTLVSQLTRDEVANRLDGIDGLVVPKTVRIRPTAVREVLPLAAASGVEAPVLVREAGSHGGHDLTLVRSPDDVDLLERFAYDGRQFYATEFVDYRSDDGRWRKHRALVVGGRPIAKHLIASASWNVHARDRTPVDESAALQQEDDEFVGASPMPFDRVLRDVHARLGLDYFGVDFGVDGAGRVVLFEANSCVRALEGTATESPIPSHRRSTEMIRSALSDRLRSLAAGA